MNSNRDSLETIISKQKNSQVMEGQHDSPQHAHSTAHGAGWQLVCPYLLGEETDVTCWRILPGCLLLRKPLEFSRNQTLVVPSVK